MKIKSFVKKLIETNSILAYGSLNFYETIRFYKNKPKMNPFGFKMVGNSSMQTGKYEPLTAMYILKFLKNSDIFVDIGANIGYFICLSRSLNKYTLAVEPICMAKFTMVIQEFRN